MNQNMTTCKDAIVELEFPINAYPIGNTPVYQVQCILQPQPLYHTLLFDFSIFNLILVQGLYKNLEGKEGRGKAWPQAYGLCTYTTQ